MIFRLGQAVRFVRGGSERAAPFRGREGRIAHVGPVRGEWLFGRMVNDSSEYLVTFDTNNWQGVLADGWQLEPLGYDGNKVVRWEECEWQPETEVEGVA